MKLIFTDIYGCKYDKIPELDKDTYVLALDGSTRRSGICIMSVGGRVGFVCAVVRSSETVVEYKLALKKILTAFISRFSIKYTAYEEPFIGFANDAKGLYMVASTLEEIAAENPDIELIVNAVNNKRWKKQFLQQKVQGSRELQKKMVYDKAVSLVPGLASCKDDETDAFGLAFYLAKCVREKALESMQSKGKPHKFGYNIVIKGSNLSTDEVLKIAGKPPKDGIIRADISTRKSFDGAVYELLQGKNAILVVTFKSGKFGDIILKHDAGELAAKSEVLSAVVTRKTVTRSKNKKSTGNTDILFT